MSGDGLGIIVVGTGSAEWTPDVMTVDIGVSVRSESVAEASSKTRDLASALIGALTDAGVERRDIATENFSVHPEYDHREGAQSLLGYRVTNELRVAIREIASGGAILDGALSAVGDPVTVNRVQLSLDDETAARDMAREAAWGDALGRAEHLARLAGRTLGSAVRITESSGQSLPPRPMMRSAMAEATPIEAGTASTSVTLEVHFELA